MSDKSIGTYRFIWGQSPDGPLYGERPIYSTRYEDTQLGTMFQVLVDGIGGVKQWINAETNEVTLKEMG